MILDRDAKNAAVVTAKLLCAMASPQNCDAPGEDAPEVDAECPCADCVQRRNAEPPCLCASPAAHEPGCRWKQWKDGQG